MSQCRFTFDFPGSAADLLSRIDNAIGGAGGSFQSRSNAGSFAIATPVGDFRGELTVSGQTVYVEVSEKPFLVSCRIIETKLREYISGEG